MQSRTSFVRRNFFSFIPLISLFLGLCLSLACKAMKDNLDDALQISTTVKTPKGIPAPRVLTLARFPKYRDYSVAHYTQQLNVRTAGSEFMFELDDPVSTECIQYVEQASTKDDDRNHLIVQGVCGGENAVGEARAWYDPFTAALKFPLSDGTTTSGNMVIDWVSPLSTAKALKGYYRRKPEKKGSHSENQFMRDFEAILPKDMDRVIDLLSPPVNDIGSIYMCGIKLFGALDMCDNCLYAVKDFREEHQKGQKSVSQAIRDELKRRKVKFEGNPEDAFVVTYHAKYPYTYADTYRAQYADYRLDYTGIYDRSQQYPRHCFVPKNPNQFTATDMLSQHTSVLVEPDIIYGYIHHLFDRVVPYNPQRKYFSFE